MGQFKPMVKMMTTEPTVELKLKKGGSAHKKMKHGGESGHKPMQKMMDGGIMSALSGATPVIAGRTASPVILFYILMESSGYVLQETSDKIILEIS